MLKKRRRNRKRKKRTKKNKQGRENYKENTGTKLITNTKKQKLKIQSRVWESQKYNVKKGRRKIKRENKQTNKQKQTMSQKLLRKYRYKIDNQRGRDREST